MRPAPPGLRRKIALTVLLLAAVAATTLDPVRESLFEGHLFRSADREAATVIESAFDRAVAAFALARATNAVISVIQETEIHASPAGIGLTLSLGEALDPVNDLVERFSWVMLVALTSLGVQRFLLEISPWLGIELLATLALITWLAGVWLDRWLPLDAGLLARRLLLLGLVVRVAVPAMAGLNHLVYERFLAADYARATAAVEQGTEDLQQADPVAALQPQGGEQDLPWWQKLPRALSRMKHQAESTLDIGRLVDWIRDRAALLIDGFLDLLVVFLLNTVLLPVVFLWGLVRLFRWLAPDARLAALEAALRRRIAGDDKAD